jgi:hypothetical protein
LLARGADPEIRDDICGGTPLAWADRHGRDEIAQRLRRDLDVNVSGTGQVWLPVVAAGLPLRTVEQRIAEASLAFYQELLELESK